MRSGSPTTPARAEKLAGHHKPKLCRFTLEPPTKGGKESKMELLTYSTDPATPLNQARLQLWCAKEVLAEANRKKDNEMKGRAMAYINKDRMALAKVARELRAKLQAKKDFRIALAGEVREFVVYERAADWRSAKEQAMEQYGEHFSFVSIDEVRK